MARFDSRDEAGRRLASALQRYAGAETTICGIPPGGAIVAATAATELGVDYECMVLCKITIPCFPDLVLGTLDADGNAMFNPASQLTRHELSKVGSSLRDRLADKVAQCRGGRPEPDFSGRTVVVIDEAVTEPLVAMGAAQYLRGKAAARLVLATPALASGVRERLSDVFDEIIGLKESNRVESANSLYAEDPPTEQVVSEHIKAVWARETVA